jgi:hypothetical protein
MDPDRRERIEAAVTMFRNGQIGPLNFRALLGACGLNATEIAEFVKEHDAANLAAYLERERLKKR